MKRFGCALLAAVALAAPAAFADGLTAGVVKRIDRGAGKISIAHEPIESLGMPKMTMVFRVKEPGMLDVAKEGDKVKFAAEKIQGAFTVTKIEVAR